VADLQRRLATAESQARSALTAAALPPAPAVSHVAKPPPPYEDDEDEDGGLNPDLPDPAETPPTVVPQVRSLVVSGDAVVGSRLTAEVDFIGCDASTSQFSWHRGGSESMLVHTGSRSYTPSAEDLGMDIFVRVAPITANGAAGQAQQASPSSPIALPADVQQMVSGWVDISGQKRFECVESHSEKERHVLFGRDKLKIRDKTQKTLAKSEGYAGVTIRFDPSPLGFTLSVPIPKKGAATFVLQCKREGERDLIALALRAFADPSGIERMPVAPTSHNSALSLAAAGQITGARPEGEDDMASSFTSEQQSLADVEEQRPPIGSAQSAAASSKPAVSKSSLKSKLSFSRNKAKK